MEEYIVGYCATEAIVRLQAVDHEYYEDELLRQYHLGLYHHKDKEFGDVAPYNNKCWCVVKAKNAMDALTKMMAIFKKETREKYAGKS